MFVNPIAVKFAYIGNAESQCPYGCMGQQVSPNGNPGADAMASVLAHELAETVTNPYGDAWYFDDNGNENADECAWQFGATFGVGTAGAHANVKLGTRYFLLQENWVNAGGGYCAVGYNASAPSSSASLTPTRTVSPSLTPSRSQSSSWSQSRSWTGSHTAAKSRSGSRSDSPSSSVTRTPTATPT